jgi:hypothetical protein
MKEACLVTKVAEYLDDNAFEIVTELPFLQRHIDIVGYKKRNSRVIAVEVKVENWQCAIKQASMCLLFADEVYIAMPTEYIHRIDRSELARFGIGLMEVNETVNIVSEAISSKYNSDHHKKQAIESINWLECSIQKRNM